MDVPHSRLLSLLQRLAQETRLIRRDLPGWYPHVLLPALQTTQQMVTAPGVTATDLDIEAIRLADILQSRPETAEIARALELAPVGSDGRAMRPQVEQGKEERLAQWILNEHEVLV